MSPEKNQGLAQGCTTGKPQAWGWNPGSGAWAASRGRSPLQEGLRSCATLSGPRKQGPATCLPDSLVLISSASPGGRRPAVEKGVPETAAARVCRVWVWRRGGPSARGLAILSPRALAPSPSVSGPSTRFSPHLNLSCLPEPSWNSRGGQAEAGPAPQERWGPCARMVSCPILDTPHAACLARSKCSINIW